MGYNPQQDWLSLDTEARMNILVQLKIIDWKFNWSDIPNNLSFKISELIKPAHRHQIVKNSTLMTKEGQYD